MNRKVDIAWEEIIKKYNILEAIKNDGKYIINAKQIKEFREPRLMTKFDNYESLPYIFKTNKLSILPISRSNFIISTNKIFIELPDSNSSIEHLDFPYYIQSIIPEDITSEAIAINCSYLTGMLEDFLEDEDLFPTVSGRMSSRSFNFEIYNNISKKNDIIEVENSQIEIDGAYEGLKYLSLLEAKKEINSDFLIRQLYYPFRLWESKITKPIKLVFLVHTNGIFSFYEYKFKDKNNYNSLELVKQKNYSLEDTTITTKNIQDILQNVEIIDEPEIPFPQADTFKRVINICELIGNNKI